MKLAEAMELLGKGKRIRKMSWPKNQFIYEDEYPYGGHLFKDNDGEYYDLTICKAAEFSADEWEVYNPNLDEVEKQYLSNIIKPFRDKVVSIRKTDYLKFWIISIKVKVSHKQHFFIFLPPFNRKANMYKGMQPEKPYTLEDLGL